MPRPQDSAKEHAIFTAAHAEVIEHGLEALSMDAIARRAGVATGTVYTYYGSKMDLLRYMYVCLKGTAAELWFDDDGSPVKARFEVVCRTFIDTAWRSVADSRFVEHIESSDAYEALIEKGYSTDDSTPAPLLERGKREGLIKDIDTQLLVDFLTNALRPFGRRMEKMRRQNREEREGTIRDYVSLCWEAVASRRIDSRTTVGKRDRRRS